MIDYWTDEILQWFNYWIMEIRNYRIMKLGNYRIMDLSKYGLENGELIEWYNNGMMEC